MRRVWALVWKDLLVEFRGREFLGAMVVFALITIVTLNFAFDLSRGSREAPGAGGLWIAFLFAGMLGVTFFGVFLTPVFYRTIRWLGRNKPLGHHRERPMAEGRSEDISVMAAAH